MKRSWILFLLAAVVIAGGLLLWRESRGRADLDGSSGPAAAETPAPPAPRSEPAPEEPPRPDDRPAAEPAEPAAAAEPAEPAATEPAAASGTSEASEAAGRTSAVLEVPESVSDEKLNRILEGYGLVVQRRFENLVRVAPADGRGDAAQLASAVKDDGLLEAEEE